MPEDGYSSNLDDLVRLEESLIDEWSLEEAADAIVGAVVDGIRERTIDRKLDASGEPLKANERRYAEAKAKKYGSTQPLVRTGQLLSDESLKGDVEATTKKVTLTYGTGESGKDGDATDRQKAEWNSEARPFYALDDSLVDERVMPIIGESLDRRLKG